MIPNDSPAKIGRAGLLAGESIGAGTSASHGGAAPGGRGPSLDLEPTGPLAGRFFVVGSGRCAVRQVVGVQPKLSDGSHGVKSVVESASGEGPVERRKVHSSHSSRSTGGSDAGSAAPRSVVADTAVTTGSMGWASIEGTVVIRSLGAGESFGESALMYDRPRGEVVRADDTGAKVFSLDAGTLRRVLAQYSARNLEQTREALRKVSILQKLTPEQLGRVALAVTEHTYLPGDRVITKGEDGDSMYFIKEGRVRCTNIGSGARKIADVVLEAGACVGERALMLDEKRAADVVVEHSASRSGAKT